MKVTDVKTFAVDCFRTNWVFVKVYTDEGITGVGEATLEYKEKALIGAVEHIKEYLIGKNPLDIEKHFHDIYRDAYWRGGAVLMSALSAVEMALWDILGKHLNVPVYQLLGGKVNDKVRIYVNGWFAGAKTPEEFGAKAKIAVQRGVTALKWDPFGKSYYVLNNNSLSKMFIIKFAEPLFACLFGAIILGENIFKWQYLIAFLLISFGIVLGNKSDKIKAD